MEYMISFLTALFELSNAMAPYILFGLLFAGVLHELVPETLVTKHLGSESVGSVIKATLFGVPLPVFLDRGSSTTPHALLRLSFFTTIQAAS